MSKNLSSRPFIDLICSHHSVREFTEEPVSAEMREAIFNAARASSSTCFLQETTVIRITDKEKQKKLAELSGHQHQVLTAPELWIFCADMHRNIQLIDHCDTGWIEQLMIGCIDTGIFGQNAMIALESLGLGGCFIGGIRNNIEAVTTLLELPKNTFPAFGIAFGHPARENELKPRLPSSITFMENQYVEPDPEVLAQYDREMEQYYAHRSANKKTTNWSKTVGPILEKERRFFMLDYLKRQGWALK